MRLATEKEKFKYLGAPGDMSKLSMAYVPKGKNLTLSWKDQYNINRFMVHKMLVPHVEAIYSKLLALDPAFIRASGVDIFGGCYNLRAVRGTEARKLPPFSTHSWGAAIDIDPARNGLYTKTAKANLAKIEYIEVHKIFKQHGFMNIGNVLNRDWMHFEASYELISNPSKFL